MNTFSSSQLPVQLKEKLERTRGRPLTEKQSMFLANYYYHDFDINKTGVERKDVPGLIRSLKDEMLELIELKLVANAGGAIQAINSILVGDKAVVNASVKLEAAKTLLDRIGVVKKDKVEVEHSGHVGLFVIPPKQEVVINADEE